MVRGYRRASRVQWAHMPFDMGPRSQESKPVLPALIDKNAHQQNFDARAYQKNFTLGELNDNDWTKGTRFDGKVAPIDDSTSQRNASLEQLVQQYALLNIGQERTKNEGRYEPLLAENMAQSALLARATVAERGLSQSQVDEMRMKIQRTPVSFGARPAPAPYQMYPSQLPQRPPQKPVSTAVRVWGRFKSLFS